MANTILHGFPLAVDYPSLARGFKTRLFSLLGGIIRYQ